MRFPLNRDFEEPGVQCSRRTRETRGCSTQGVEGDEEETRRRGPGLIVVELEVESVEFACVGACLLSPIESRLWMTVLNDRRFCSSTITHHIDVYKHVRRRVHSSQAAAYGDVAA